MKKILINTSTKYYVTVGSGLLSKLDELIPELIGKNTVLVTDDAVDALYSDKVISSLEKICTVNKFVFKNGEESKNINTLFEILEFCAKSGLDRSSAIVALGGGVVGDIAALASALYMRGIKFFNIATTLLAMIDSSVGGKTAIDLPSGKNLAGVFKQPNGVICDTDALDTLPEDVYIGGMAEAVKYNILYKTDIDCDIQHLVCGCVEAKNKCVSADEFESGQRAFLNLGHTPAHAIEACSGYTVPHGFAVGAGLAIMARASFRKGLCSEKTCNDILSMLEKHRLPLNTDFCAKELAEKIKSDKKAKGTSVTFVIPAEIGNCVLEKIKFEDIEEFISLGIE